MENLSRDGWRPIVASILLAKTAVATFSIAPFLIGGYIDYLHLTVGEASRTLSVEIFALAFANASAFFWIHKVSCRRWARRILFTLIALNILCIFAPSHEALLGLRALVGFCEGALLALGFGLLGITKRPSRNFGLYFAISLTVGAINIRLLPLFLESAGVTGLFINLSLYSIIALLGSTWIQQSSIGESRKDAPADTPAEIGAPTGFAIAAVPLLFLMLANYVYFVGQGGVWSFFERLGVQQGVDLVGIANALALSLFAGVAGGATAWWLDLKLGRVVPLLAAIGLAVMSIGLMFLEPSITTFTLAACLFNYGNNMGHPYVLSFAAKIDKSSRLTVLSGALHTGGQATGPIIAGLIVVGGDFTNVLWLGLASFLLTVVLFIPVAFSWKGSSD
jgi:DHA1 family inner membrane transport protein